MSEVDIGGLISSTAMDPNEAARGIVGAKVFETDAEEYIRNKNSYEKQFQMSLMPQTAPKVVADYMARGPAQASAVKDDISTLSALDKFAARIKRRGAQSDTADKMAPFLEKKMAQNGELSMQDEIALEAYRLQQEENQQDKDYDPIVNFPVEMYGIAKDLVGGLIDERAFIIGGAAAGGTGGAVIGGTFGGPVAAAVIGGIGALKGAAVGAMIAGTVDTYKSTRNDIYNTLDTMTDDVTGERLGLPEDEKRYLAKGAAGVVAAIDLIGDANLAKAIPGFGAIINPKEFAKRMIKDGSNAEVRSIVKTLGKSMVMEGGTEALQEFVQIVAEEAGRSWDGKNPVSFWSGVKSAVDNWESTDKRQGTVKRVATAGALGAIAGGVVKGGGMIIEAPFKKPGAVVEPPGNPDLPPVVPSAPEAQQANPDLPPTVVNEPEIEPNKLEALTHQLHLTQASAVTKNMTLYKNAPEEAMALRDQIIEQSGGVRVQYVDVDVMTNFMNSSPENALLVQQVLGTESFAQQDIGAPLEIPIAKAMALIDGNPKAAALFSNDPAGPTIAGIDAQKTPEASALEAKKKEIVNTPEYKEKVGNEEEYRDQKIFTTLLEKEIPKSIRQREVEAQKFARFEIVERIDKAADKERQAVINTNMEVAVEVEREQLEMELRDNPEVAIVEQQAKFNIRINPKSLDPSMEGFLSDRTLRKRTVFSSTGLDIKDATKMFGVPNERVLLDILANVPNVKEAVDKIVEARKQEIAAQVDDSVDLLQEGKIKEYENTSRLHRMEADWIRKHSWPSMKQGIKTIAVKRITIPEIRTEAERMTGDTQLKNLNVNKYKQGEIRSVRKALDAYLSNQIELSYLLKENAIKNVELQRANAIAIGKSNSNVKYIKRMLRSPGLKAALRKAGPKYYGAYVELVDTFNLDKKLKGKSIPGAYAALVKKLLKENKVDISIDPKIFYGVPTNIEVKDLTVKQLETLTQAFKVLIHAAKRTEEFGVIKAQRAEEIKTILADHPDKDLTRIDKPDEPQGFFETGSHYINKGAAGLTSLAFVTQILDKGVAAGYFTKQFYLKLKEGEYAAKKRGAILSAEYRQVIEQYGKAKFEELNNTIIPNIPEFENIPSLRNGKGITKLDLFMMMAHWGEIEGREGLDNFGLDSKGQPIDATFRDNLFKVLERHLTIADVDLIQSGIWDQYDKLKNEVIALEEKTKGAKPEMVDAAPFRFQDKDYAGGHFPKYYKKQFSLSKVAEIMRGEEFRPGFSANGMTKANYLRERIGSDQILNLDPTTITIGFDEVIWDLYMREPVKEVTELLLDREIAHEIISVVGKDKYQVMVNTVAEATHSALADQMQLYAEQRNMIKNITYVLNRNFAITHLAANMGSIAVQPLSLFNAAEKMGPLNGAKHLVYALAKLGTPEGLKNLKNLLPVLIEINPEIGTFLEEGTDVSVTGLRKSQPKKRLINKSLYRGFKNVQEGLNEALMTKLLALPDFFQKIAVTMAAYSQHMAGEAPGHPLESMIGWTDEQRKKAAIDYVRSISTTTLTTTSKLDKAPIQKVPGLDMFIAFWNDARNQLNTAFQVNRNIKYEVQAIRKAVADGNIVKAIGHFDDAGSKVLTLLWITSTTALLQKMIQDEEEIFEKSPGQTISNIVNYYTSFAKLPKNLEPADIPKKIASNTGALFKYRFGTVMPVARNIVRAAESYSKGWKLAGQVSIPIVKVPTDIAITVSLMTDAIRWSMLTPKEQKSVLSAVGYMTGGLPVNGALALYENLDAVKMIGFAGAGLTVNAITALKDLVTDNAKNKSEYKGEEGQLFATQEEINKAVAMIRQESFIESLDGEIKSYYKKMIKAESDKQPYVVNPSTGAFGLHQFLPSTWRLYQTKYPDADIPIYEPKKLKNGDVIPKGFKVGDFVTPDKPPSVEDQIKVWKLMVTEHINAMTKKEIVVTDESLHMLHVLGQGAGIKVLSQFSDTKRMMELLPSYLDEESWKYIVSKNPQFERTWTVGDMKKWVKRTINKD